MGVCGFVRIIEFGFGKFAFFVEFLGKEQFIGEFGRFVIIVDPLLFRAKVFYEDFRFFGVVPKVGSKGFLFLVCNFNQFGIDVKDTSSAHQGALQYL